MVSVDTRSREEVKSGGLVKIRDQGNCANFICEEKPNFFFGCGTIDLHFPLKFKIALFSSIGISTVHYIGFHVIDIIKIGTNVSLHVMEIPAA
jgi:hypothetical protein